MIFCSKIKKPKRIHISENVINRLKPLFENSEDEGGMLNVYGMSTDPSTGEPTLLAKYNYLPNDDNVYADFSNYKGKVSPSIINGQNSTRVELGQGDLVKTKDNISPDKVPVEGGEFIDCFNLSMLGDDKVKTMLAHIYKGKSAAYPLNKNYRIMVTGDDGEIKPNLIKGEYLKKIKDLILHTPGLYDFKPNYIIYPQSSSNFNEYILNFLTSKGGPFPYAKPIAKENGEFVMTKSDVWGIDYSTLIGLGKSEMNQNYGYKNFYSKNRKTKNKYEQEYFSNTIATILEPRIIKLIPSLRKMFYLENYTKNKTINIGGGKQVTLWSLIENRLRRKGEIETNKNKNKMKSLDAFLSAHPEIWNNHTKEKEDEFFNNLNRQNSNESKKTYGLSSYGKKLYEAIAGGYVRPTNDLKSEAEIAREKQNARTLVNLKDIPEIEQMLGVIDRKYGTHELNDMYNYVSDGEMVGDERKLIIDNIHEYFMSEMGKFNEAGKQFGLSFDFTRPPFGEELLLRIYRYIFSHDVGDKKVASGPKSKNFMFPNYETFAKAFESGEIEMEDDKRVSVINRGTSSSNGTRKRYFSFDMPNLIKNAEKTDTIKNYAIVPRLSIYNQFKFNDNVDLKQFNSKGRYLIIDDNYASGASLRNAAKLLHDTLGVSYKNIKALTPGDMGGAATGGAQGEDIATYAAEGALVNDLRKGRLKNAFGNNPVDLEVLNRIKEVAGRIKTNKKTGLPKLDKNGNPIFKVSHQVSDELADSHFDANGNSVLGQSSLPDFNYNVNSVDVPNYDFKIRDYKKYLQSQNPVSSSNDESEPLKMAANKVQSAPVSRPRIEKVDIFNQLSSPEKEEERRMLQDKLENVMEKLKKATSRKEKANLLNGERAIIQNEIDDLITQRDKLRAEIRRITTEYAQTSEPVSQAPNSYSQVSKPVSQNPQVSEPVSQNPSDSTTASPIRHYSEDELKKIHRAKKVSPEEIDNVIVSLGNDIKNIEMTARSFIKDANTEQQKAFFKNYWDRVKWKKKFEKLKERKCN